MSEKCFCHLNGFEVKDAFMRNHLKNTGVITPQMYGAKGDGITDDSDAIQSAIDSLEDGMTLYFPVGTYLVHPFASYGYRVVNGVEVNTGVISPLYNAVNGFSGYNFGVKFYKKNNINIEFAPGTKIKGFTTNYTQTSYCFFLQECKNVNIIGGEFIGDIPDLPVDSDGNPVDINAELILSHFGLNISSCENVIVFGTHAHNWAGAGIYVGGHTHSKNVTVDHCHIHDCYYHCLVFEGVDNSVVRNTTCYRADTGVEDYACSFDCEGRSDSDPNKNILIENCYFGYSEKTSLGLHRDDGVIVINCTFDSQQTAIQEVRNITIKNCKFKKSKLLFVANKNKHNVYINNNVFVDCEFDIKNVYKENYEYTFDNIIFENNIMNHNSRTGEIKGFPVISVRSDRGNPIKLIIRNNIINVGSGDYRFIDVVGDKKSMYSYPQYILIENNEFNVKTDNVVCRYLFQILSINVEFVNNVITVQKTVFSPLKLIGGVATQYYNGAVFLLKGSADSHLRLNYNKIHFNGEIDVIGAPSTPSYYMLTVFTDGTESYPDKPYEFIGNMCDITTGAGYTSIINVGAGGGRALFNVLNNGATSSVKAITGSNTTSIISVANIVNDELSE